MMCSAPAALIQCASASPRRLVLSSATTAANAGDAEPDRQIVRLVAHEKANRPAAEPVRPRPAGDGIDPPGEFAEAQSCVIGEQGRRVAETRREFVDHLRQRALRLAVDPRRQFKRPQPRFGGRKAIAVRLLVSHSNVPGEEVKILCGYSRDVTGKTKLFLASIGYDRHGFCAEG